MATPVVIIIEQHTVDEKELGGLHSFSDVNIHGDRDSKIIKARGAADSRIITPDVL